MGTVLSIRILLTPWRTAMGHRGRKSRWPIKLVTRRQSANVFLIPLTLSQDPLPAMYPSSAVLPSPWLSLRPRLLPFFLFSSSSPSRSSWNGVHYPPTALRRWYTPLNLQLGTCLPRTLIKAFVREPLVTVKRRRAPRPLPLYVTMILLIFDGNRKWAKPLPLRRELLLRTVDGVVYDKFRKLVRSFKGTIKLDGSRNVRPRFRLPVLVL